MKKFLFYLIQFTWGLPQNLAGLIGYLILSRKNKHERFHYAVVTYVEKENFGGVSLGIFIFMNPKLREEWRHDTRIHEYGHTIQSLLLGPLYFFVIGIPSAVWCSLPPLVKYRKEKDVSYYALYCEGWANLWGRRWAKDNFISDEMKNRGYYGKPLAALKF